MAKKSEIKKLRSLKDFDDPNAEARVQRVIKATGGHLSIPNPKYSPPPPDTRPSEERTIGKGINVERDAEVQPVVRRSKRIAKVEADEASNTGVKIEGRDAGELGSKRKIRSLAGTTDDKKPAPRTLAPQTPRKGKDTKRTKSKK